MVAGRHGEATGDGKGVRLIGYVWVLLIKVQNLGCHRMPEVAELTGFSIRRGYSNVDIAHCGIGNQKPLYDSDEGRGFCYGHVQATHAFPDIEFRKSGVEAACRNFPAVVMDFYQGCA